MSDLFVLIMSIMCPLLVLMIILAFAPSPSTIKGWFKK